MEVDGEKTGGCCCAGVSSDVVCSDEATVDADASGAVDVLAGDEAMEAAGEVVGRLALIPCKVS